MGSVFDTVSKKVTNLLGITALGQAAKAGSLPVTLASDEDDIHVANDWLITQVNAANVNSDSYTEDGISFIDFHSLKLGSTNGSTYGTGSFILIPMAVSGWRTLWLRVRSGATFMDQTITMAMYESITSQAFNNRGGKLLDIDFSASTDRLCSFGNGVVGQDGVTGGATVAANAYYRVVPSEGVEYITITFSGTAPSTGAFDNFTIGRGT
jgi:hypothetical protein